MRVWRLFVLRMRRGAGKERLLCALWKRSRGLGSVRVWVRGGEKSRRVLDSLWEISERVFRGGWQHIEDFDAGS